MVENIGGNGKSISPVDRRHGSLEEEGAGDVIDGADHALGFLVLLGSIGARHAESDAVSKKAREAELSNSRPLSHWTDLMVQPNWVDT